MQHVIFFYLASSEENKLYENIFDPSDKQYITLD